MRIRFLIFALVAVFGFSNAPVFGQTNLRNQNGLVRAIDRLIDEELFENALWGIYIRDLNSGTTLYSRNEGKSFVPASNTKIFTTAAALDQLGPQYSFETSIWTNGTISNGRLSGSLIVRGSGDPSIGGRFYEEDPATVFRSWADSLRARGISTVDGDLVGDDDLFDDLHLGFGWNWDDEIYAYSAEIGALVFNEGCVPITLRGGIPGTPGELVIEHSGSGYATFENRSVSTHADSSLSVRFSRERASNHFAIDATIPQGREEEECLAISDPTGFFLAALRQTLLDSGIAVTGRTVDVDQLVRHPDYEVGTLTHLFSHYSLPLRKLVQQINKDSNNLYAEQVLKTLGAIIDSTGVGSAESGIRAATTTYSLAAVDTSRLQLVDGSGLSRRNLIAPEMAVNLLTYMRSHPDTAVVNSFFDSLPIAGVDGSLERRFSGGGPAKSNARAKTGHMGNISTLSGYVVSAGGTPFAFSIMCNNFTARTREVDAVQDIIINLLAGYRR